MDRRLHQLLKSVSKRLWRLTEVLVTRKHTFMLLNMLTHTGCHSKVTASLYGSKL